MSNDTEPRRVEVETHVPGEDALRVMSLDEFRETVAANPGVTFAYRTRYVVDGGVLVTTDTLVDFLLARIAEDEAVARAATPGPWHADVDYSTVTADPFKSARAAYNHDYSLGEVDCWVIPESMDSGVGAHNLAHIARHDPARVLAECEAKRRIMERHGPELGADSCDEWEREWPCTAVRAIASVYADHPDYREDWRP